MDFGVGDGRSPPESRAVNQDGRLGDVGAVCQAPGGPGTNSDKPILIPGRTTRVGTCRHYRQHGDGSCGATLGRGGAGRTDSVSLQYWLLQFRAASGELRLIVSNFTEWLGNGRPPWDANRALISVRLIALDKQPGIRPVCVGETWRRIMAKCLLQVTRQEAKAAYGTA